jgi:hypothetical protein
MANRTKLTRRKENKFISVLADTANVSAACDATGMSRQGAYDHKAANPEFAALWDAAVETATDKLELEARRRAFRGTRKGVYWKGVRVATEREYSDSLTMFLLRGHRPDKYRENVKAEVVSDVRLHVVYDDERTNSTVTPPPSETE